MNHQSINMGYQLLDGQIAAKAWHHEIFEGVQQMVAAGHAPPHLSVLRIGEDPASRLYVRNKERSARSIGFSFNEVSLPADADQGHVENVIDELNHNDAVDAYILQLPIPSHLDLERLILTMSPDKDADGFHPVNLGKLFREHPDAILPATPQGILRLLRHYNVAVEGRHCVVVGRSLIVGKPMAMLLQRKHGMPANATVTLVHSRSRDAKQLIRQGDVVIVAIGNPHWLSGEMIKAGAVVIDVGIHRVASPRGYQWVGDVDFASVAPRTQAITPVPGGVGPMTVASLLWNVFTIARRRR